MGAALHTHKLGQEIGETNINKLKNLAEGNIYLYFEHKYNLNYK